MRTGEGAVLRQMGAIFGAGTVAGMSDEQLLDRFVARRDEAAFEALVARHGPLVLGVCRNVLRDPDDAEDAFQATFLILVHRAGTIRRRGSLGPWLHGVAFRVCAGSVTESARRRRRERIASMEFPRISRVDDSERERRVLLHDEIERLPEKYRSPIVLCYMEGLTHDEAASRLDWPVGTVRGRLARARDLLRGRLARRGMTATMGLIGWQLSRNATGAAISPTLSGLTVRAAMKVAAGERLTAGIVSASVATLTRGALKTMFLTKLKVAAGAALAFGIAVTGAGVLARQAAETAPSPAPSQDAPPPATAGTSDVPIAPAGESAPGDNVLPPPPAATAVEPVPGQETPVSLLSPGDASLPAPASADPLLPQPVQSQDGLTVVEPQQVLPTAPPPGPVVQPPPVDDDLERDVQAYRQQEVKKIDERIRQMSTELNLLRKKMQEEQAAAQKTQARIQALQELRSDLLGRTHTAQFQESTRTTRFQGPGQEARYLPAPLPAPGPSTSPTPVLPRPAPYHLAPPPKPGAPLPSSAAPPTASTAGTYTTLEYKTHPVPPAPQPATSNQPFVYPPATSTQPQPAASPTGPAPVGPPPANGSLQPSSAPSPAPAPAPATTAASNPPTANFGSAPVTTVASNKPTVNANFAVENEDVTVTGTVDDSRRLEDLDRKIEQLLRERDELRERTRKPSAPKESVDPPAPSSSSS